MEIKELLTALGWTDLGQQKNPYMMSFIYNGVRMNVYFTTMTVTVQSSLGIKTYRDVTLEELEKISNENRF